MYSELALEAAAAEAGYENERDYAMDNNMSQCEDCGRWGIDGYHIDPIPVGELDVEWVCRSCEKKRNAVSQ